MKYHPDKNSEEGEKVLHIEIFHGLFFPSFLET